MKLLYDYKFEKQGEEYITTFTKRDETKEEKTIKLNETGKEIIELIDTSNDTNEILIKLNNKHNDVNPFEVSMHFLMFYNQLIDMGIVYDEKRG